MPNLSFYIITQPHLVFLLSTLDRNSNDTQLPFERLTNFFLNRNAIVDVPTKVADQ